MNARTLPFRLHQINFESIFDIWSLRHNQERWGGAMSANEASSYADPMAGSTHEERAALVALLQARPEGLRWPEISAEVLETGSALEVWHRLVPPTLVEAPDQPGALESAAQEISRWAD
jgi:hypothetical protein